jgi:hypothetical protein
MAPRTNQATSDHDLLIEINTKLNLVTATITTKQAEHDNRLTKLEEKTANNSRFIWMGMGGLIVIEFVLNIVFKG